MKEFLGGGFYFWTSPLINATHPYQVIRYFRRVDEMRNAHWLLAWWAR